MELLLADNDADESARSHKKDPVDCSTVLSDRSITNADLTPGLVDSLVKVSEKFMDICDNN